MSKLAKVLIVAGLTVLLAFSVVGARKYSASHGDAWLGVYTQSVDREIAEKFGLESKWGALIAQVVDDSPAEEAGLRDDDVVISFEGRKITDQDDLIDAIDDAAPGDEVVITVIRDGDKKDIKVQLGDEQKSHSYSYTFNSSDWDDDDNVWVNVSNKRPYLGLRLIDLNDQLAAFLKMKEDDGAFVTEILEDSPAEKAGLKAGDVIVSIDGEAVDNREEFIDELGDHDKGDEVELGVVRDGKQLTVKATLDEGDSDVYWGDNVIMIPPVPDVDMNIPKLRGMYYGNFDRDEVFDSEEFQGDMDELREELKALKKELQEQIKDWKKYKDEH